jgi:DNA-directed RNA polymerase subunit RPC12/RpoP
MSEDNYLDEYNSFPECDKCGYRKLCEHHPTDLLTDCGPFALNDEDEYVCLKCEEDDGWNFALDKAATLFDDDIDYTADEIRERLASLRRRS